MPTHDITHVDPRIKAAAAEVAHRGAQDTLALVDKAAAKLAYALGVREPQARAALLMLVVDLVGLELRGAGRDLIDSYAAERAAEGTSVRAAVRELEDVMIMSRSGINSAFGRRTDPPTPAAIARASSQSE